MAFFAVDGGLSTLVFSAMVHRLWSFFCHGPSSMVYGPFSAVVCELSTVVFSAMVHRLWSMVLFLPWSIVHGLWSPFPLTFPLRTARSTLRTPIRWVYNQSVIPFELSFSFRFFFFCGRLSKPDKRR